MYLENIQIEKFPKIILEIKSINKIKIDNRLAELINIDQFKKKEIIIVK